MAANSWPESTRLLNKDYPRLDGLAKASGRAKYPSDERPEGTLFGVILYSPHAHARIKSIDTAAAEKMPGVKAVEVIAGPGKLVRYHGDDIAVVAAETEEQARDAVRAIQVEYEVLPHAATEAQAMAENAAKVIPSGNVRKGRAQVDGKPEEGLAKADAVIEATYSVPVVTHVCLEPHGLTARWDDKDHITAWASTQAVTATASELAESNELPISNVTVLTEVMGGGFGSKFGADLWGTTAARISKKVGGRPVKIFLDRIQEHLAGGNRPSAMAKVKIGATKDGKITGMIAETFGTGGVARGSGFPLPYVYKFTNFSREHADVFVNGGNSRAMRAPGHPQGCLIMESALDDLAAKLGVDPLVVRKANLGKDLLGDQTDRTQMYLEQIDIGAELIGWSKNFQPRGSQKGIVRRGLGVALHQWGGGGAPDKQVSCTVFPDGTIELKSATQDIGTGIRTVMAMIAAEVFGLQPTDIKSNIGNSTFPPGQSSGGSTTTPSMSPPCYNACLEARDEFFKKIAPALPGAPKPEDLSLADGKLMVKGEAAMSFKDAARKIGMNPISVTGKFSQGLSSNGVAGVQFADVTVDIETGVVKLNKIVAVQDSGLILDKLTWNSQVYGGVIGGLNYGLFEERVMDPVSGRMLNPDMELYQLAGASDIPEIVIHAYEPAAIKKRGVIGIGEPPTIGTAAAIGNAVSNAIGVRVTNWPMTPINVLNALAQAGKV
ncbi:molybdopterin-dependent oxidoreductase [bacterium]|nr:molybdopterin-dependent oxidoreductase [bacterium]